MKDFLKITSRVLSVILDLVVKVAYAFITVGLIVSGLMVLLAITLGA